jgi:adhesin transport system membrane fusion protein
VTAAPPGASPIDRILADHPVPSLRVPAWICGVFLTIGLVWAWQAQLDEVAIARGEVIPQGRVKVVQHLEGGIVQSIAVQEGSKVVAGDLLLTLELSPTAINREELQIRLDAFVLNRSRLEAEANGGAPQFPAAEAGRRPELVRTERESYDARRREFQAALAGIQEQARQRELLLQELEATKVSKINDLRLARERLRLGASLLSGNLIPRIEYIQMQRDVEKLDGEHAVLLQQIPRAEAAISEMRERLREEQIKFQRQAFEELGRVEAQLQRTRELLADAVGQRVRTEIRSPSDGIVKNIRYTTVGGVVRPGDPIMEVVPADDRLVVEAKLSPVDRGYVREGQRAIVKVTAYEFVRYGGLEGKVALIAADTTTENNGTVYFRVVVETDRSHLGERAGDYPVVAGMQATVDIQTGARSVIDYLVRPVLKLRHEAFRER